LKVNNQEESENGIFVVKEPAKFRNEIQELMKLNAGIIRDNTKLKNGLKRILELKKKFYSKRSTFKEFKIEDNNNGENIILTWEVSRHWLFVKQ